MPSLSWSLFTPPTLEASVYLLVLSSVFVPVCYGLLREPLCCRIPTKDPREDTLPGSGPFSTWVVSLVLWYVLIFFLSILFYHHPTRVSVRFPRNDLRKIRDNSRSDLLRSLINGFQIPLGQNIHVKTNSTVSDGTYIAFIILMFIGFLLALLLCNAKDIYREDGSRVVLMKHPTWQSEFIGLYTTLRTEPYIILLFPMFWSSNWFTTYQFNAFNGSYFNTRTKSLNNLLYWTAQIWGALIFGYCLDIERVRRTVRAKVCVLVLFVITMVIWGGGYDFAKTYTRADVAASTFVPMDWQDDGYVGKMFLYIFYGFYDASWQASAYW